MNLNESIVEDAALEWFGELGYAVGHGPVIASGEAAACVCGIGHPIPDFLSPTRFHKCMAVNTAAWGVE